MWFTGGSTNDREGIEGQLGRFAELARSAGRSGLHVVCRPADGYEDILRNCTEKAGYEVDLNAREVDRFREKLEAIELVPL